MAVSAIQVGRVSQNLRAFQLLSTVRSTQLGLFRTQNQLATGLAFQTPSEAPREAAITTRLDRQLDVLGQVRGNLQTINVVMAAGEGALQEASNLMIDARRLASEAANSTLSAEDRSALRIVADSTLDALVSIGNRKHLDAYLFGGHYGERPPFERTGEGVLYRGDEGRLRTIVDSSFFVDDFTVPGADYFDAVSKGVEGFVDLDPAVTAQTRLADLGGATGEGVSMGRIRVSDGTQTVDVDLTPADTVGDVLDILNDRLPATLRASLTPRAIQLEAAEGGPVAITVVDVAGGRTAVQLGIFAESPLSVLAGADLHPRVTERSNLADLLGGLGLELNGAIRLRNGSRDASITFGGVETVEDLLNRFNQSDAGVWARIAADGRRVEILNRLSGTDLAIEELGSGAATALGVRSMHAGTALASLNDGDGVLSVPGDDFRITTANGTQIDVDIDDLDLASATLEDLIAHLNSVGGGAIAASLRTSGNGIRIVDLTVGGGALRIERLNVSPAIDGLGLNVEATGPVLRGDDVNPIRVDSPFTALIELREALSNDDNEGITRAGQRLEAVFDRMQEVQGQYASKARAMLDRADRAEFEATATEVMRSDVRDADLAEAIVRFQQMQTALQANLGTASRVMNLSLLDFLR